MINVMQTRRPGENLKLITPDDVMVSFFLKLLFFSFLKKSMILIIIFQQRDKLIYCSEVNIFSLSLYLLCGNGNNYEYYYF